jgi:hypothetical protein
VCNGDGTFSTCACAQSDSGSSDAILDEASVDTGALDGAGLDATIEAQAEASIDTTLGDAPSDAPGTSPGDALPTTLSGAVQKGPFVRGSSVTVQELDSTLTPTGRSFQVTTNDDEGDFDIPVTVSSQYVEVIATGYYYDELAGALTSGQLTLRALADLTSGGTVNVNLLTSMSEPLVKKLVTSGTSFSQGRAQAEGAVLSALGFSSSSLGTSFTSVGLTGAGSANAEALAATLIVAQYAQSQAHLTQLLGEIGATTVDSGGDATLSALNAALCPTILAIDAVSVRTHLTAYYASLGVSVTVPPFEQFLCGGCGVLCGGTCVDKSTNASNCGACGNVCPSAASCVSSACVCPGSLVACSGACVDRTQDNNNCGVCGNVCPTGTSCSASTCSCNASYEHLCGGTCVNLGADNNNCGVCGHVCPGGTACTNAGSFCDGYGCCCPTGYVRCNDACLLSVLNDPNNCGACGVVCSGATPNCVGTQCQ